MSDYKYILTHFFIHFKMFLKKKYYPLENSELKIRVFVMLWLLGVRQGIKQDL